MISIDRQYYEKCLPYTLFVGDTEYTSDLNRGELAYFRSKKIEPSLEEDQLVVKIIGAIHGDRVEVRNNRLSINGVDYGALQLNESLGKKIGDYDRVIEIAEDELFMIGTLPGSFDSRYWGNIKKSQVVARGYAIL